MRKILFLFLVALPVLAMAQTDSLLPGVYSWKAPKEKKQENKAVMMFEGQTNSMQWLQMTANSLSFSTRKYTPAASNDEQLILIKSGGMMVYIADAAYTVGAGSIVLLLPGEKVSFVNTSKDPCYYYALRYRSKHPGDVAKAKAGGGYLVKDWDTVAFKPGEKGGRRNFLERSTAMCKRLEIHATTLKPGLKSHAPHTHPSAEFTLIKEGKTEMLIGDKYVAGSDGDVYYAPSNVLHALENKGTVSCTYFAIQFE